MKKIIILSSIILIVFLIFLLGNSHHINYVSIGDTINKGFNAYGYSGYGFNNYIKNYLQKNDYLQEYNDSFYNTSMNNLIDDLKNNKTLVINNKEYSFKKVLRESDILVISIGMDELAYYFYNDYANLALDIEKIEKEIDDGLKEIKKYAKNNIIFLGYYNPLNNYNSEIDALFYKLDDDISNILEKYHIMYIPLYEKIKAGNYMENNNYHLKTNGYLMIAEEIIKYLEKTL